MVKNMDKVDVEKFLLIEHKYKLNYLEYEGINFWQYARYDIWNTLVLDEKLSLGEAHRKKKLISFRSISLIIYNFVKSFVECSLLKKGNVDICFLNHSRRIWEKDYYECMYTERLAEIYPNSVVLEKPYNYSHLKPIKTQNVYYTDWIIIVGNLFYKLHFILKTSKYKKAYKNIANQLVESYKELKDAYEIGTTIDKMIEKCVERYFICRIQYKLYAGLLKKIHPKVIIEVCHYSRQNMLINEIAEKLDIPTVELQHGVISKNHVAYNYYSKNKIPQLPTNILLFSNFWKPMIHMPINSENISITGFPFFEAKLEEYKKIQRENERKTILFISQGTIGRELSQFAVDLSNKLDVSEYRIIYKLHPGEYEDWKKQYKELSESEIEVADNFEKNMYWFFSQSDIQIGVNSTAIFEGVGFGLDTYIYSTSYGNLDFIQNLINTGYAKSVGSVDEFLKALENSNHQNNIECFWKSDAFKNQCEEINKYLRDI